MRVLHYPFNLASQMAITVRAERRLGLDAVGIAREVKESYRNDNEGITLFKTRIIFILAWLKLFWKADVLHCYAGGKVFPFHLELILCRIFRKRRIVEWMGSEIRRPKIEARLNPYYKEAFPEWEYKESEFQSLRMQWMFRLAGFDAVINAVSLADYMVTPFHRIERRVDVPTRRPKIRKMPKRPRVLHAPSARVTKGTKYVDEAMKDIDVDYVRLEGRAWREVQEEIRRADIVIDQLILGEFGLFSIEAMAQGKPVLCYMREGVVAGYKILELWNATIEDLAMMVHVAQVTGQESMPVWEFARKTFHSDVVAKRLKGIYEAHPLA